MHAQIGGYKLLAMVIESAVSLDLHFSALHYTLVYAFNVTMKIASTYSALEEIGAVSEEHVAPCRFASRPFNANHPKYCDAEEAAHLKVRRCLRHLRDR